MGLLAFFESLMPKRTIAVGDIHGCALALQRLIEAVRPTADDLVVTLGDYVDRGPESRQVVDLLIDLEDRCQLAPLLGNHEIMMLEALEDLESLRFWLECGGMATVESYGGGMEEIPAAHLAFFHRCHRFVETEDFIFLHANYDPDLPLDAQPDRLLFWEHVVRRLPPEHYTGKTVIVGHTPQTSGEILDLGHLICLDTYCVGDGWLTAMEMESRQVWQANKQGELRAP